VALGSQLNATLGAQGALAVLGELASIAAAGTTQATATAITTAIAIVTTTPFKGGVRLPVTPTVSASDRLHVANHGANDLYVYPPVGGKLSNNTANVPALIAQQKCADFMCIDGTNYTAMLSA
jgi:Flp pilus assembly secretin CpaC